MPLLLRNRSRKVVGQTDPARRAGLLREAETLLVRDEAPIAPLFFYNGFTYFNPDRIQGIHPNILDVHPINAIRRVDRRERD